MLINVLPNLAKRIRSFFINQSRVDLAKQVDYLRIKSVCECGDPDCGSFYLTQYTEIEDGLEGFDFEGIGSIEVSEGKIGFIEIFPSDMGFNIRSSIKKIYS